jgi:hypothetical protein
MTSMLRSVNANSWWLASTTLYFRTLCGHVETLPWSDNGRYIGV